MSTGSRAFAPQRAHQLIASFVSTTQSDAGTAATFLSQANFILEKALNLFFEQMSSSTSVPNVPVASGVIVDLISDGDGDDDDDEHDVKMVPQSTPLAASSHKSVPPIKQVGSLSHQAGFCSLPLLQAPVASGAASAPMKSGRSHIKHVIPSDGKLLVRQSLVKGLATQRGTNLLMPGEEVELRAHVQSKRSAGGSKKNTGSSYRL
jgi:hypothetical protein